MRAPRAPDCRARGDPCSRPPPQATLPALSFALRLAAVFAVSLATLAAPIAAQSYDPATAPAECAAAAALGALLVTGALVLRLYLGWDYVTQRLLSAAVPYEETGWYDGRTFAKPPPVLARDRLLGRYEAVPIRARLRQILTGIVAASLAAGLGLAAAPTAPDGGRAAPRLVGGAPVFSSAVLDPADLATDDDAAEAEAAAQGGRPGYCGDELLRAAAGASAAMCAPRR